MSSRRAKPSTSVPARPGLAPPPRRAPPRPDPPVVCPGFGLGRFIRRIFGKYQVSAQHKGNMFTKRLDPATFEAAIACTNLRRMTQLAA